MLEKRHINIAMVPANCTDSLQPLEVSINNFKAYLKSQLQDLYVRMPRIYVLANK